MTDYIVYFTGLPISRHVMASDPEGAAEQGRREMLGGYEPREVVDVDGNVVWTAQAVS